MRPQSHLPQPAAGSGAATWAGRATGCARGAPRCAVRLGAVAARDRDVELGIAPHAVLGDVEAGRLDVLVGADPDRHLEDARGSPNEAVNVNAPTAASPSAWMPSWCSPPP